MFLRNMDNPSCDNKVKIWQSFKVQHFDHASPTGACDGRKCQEPLDELSVQVPLLYHHQNFTGCTLRVSGTELRTDGRTNRRTDDPLPDAPVDLSDRG